MRFTGTARRAKGSGKMEERETRIARWFAWWLRGGCGNTEELFAPDAVYVESWGPEYHGAAQIAHWFREWHTRGQVLQWDIRQFFHKGDQSVVEWAFHCRMNDGSNHCFDGVSLIRWGADGRIALLKEFACDADTYDPYRNGETPEFRDET